MITTTKDSKNSTKINMDGKKVQMVPPDGGWGYMICFSLVIMFVSMLASHSAFGLIYNDFLISIGSGSSGISVMHSVSSLIVSITSLFTAAAMKRYSLRQVGIVGSAIGTFGYTLQIFARTITEVIIYNAIVSMAGGILMSVVYTAFNSYFVTKRIFLLSACKAIVGVMFMVYPMIIKWLMDVYGFRGTLAILAAMSLNSLLGMLVIHPVSWHLVEKIADEKDPVNEINTNNLGSKIQINIQCTEGDNSNNNDDREKKSNEDEQIASATLLIPTNDRRFSTPTIKITNTDRRSSIPPGNDISNENDVKKKNLNDQLQAVSMLSIGSFDNAALTYQIIDDSKGEQGIWQKVATILDLKLLTDYVYLNIVIGMSAALFSEMMFSLLFPLMLFTIGFTADKVALSLSAYAAGDMMARFLLAGVSKFIPLNPRNIFFSGVLLSFSFRIAINFTNEFYLIAAIAAVIGVAKCLTHLMIPLILGDHVPIEKYPAAHGIYMLFYGILNILLGPIVGIIRDITQSYKLTFDLLNCAFLICLVGWTVEGILNRRKKKEKIDE